MPSENQAATAAAHTQMEIHVMRPRRQACSEAILVVQTQNSESIVQNEGPFIFTASADVSYNVVKTSLIPDFFRTKGIQRIRFGEVTAQYWWSATARLPPTLFPGTHSIVTFQARSLITSSSSIPWKIHDCESSSIKTITTAVHKAHPENNRSSQTSWCATWLGAEGNVDMEYRNGRSSGNKKKEKEWKKNK